MCTNHFPSEVSAKLNYFSRNPRFEHEKPFVTSFPVDEIEGAAITNHEFDTRLTKVRNIRGQSLPSLNTHGFTYLTSPTLMTLAEFDESVIVREKYFPELKDIWRPLRGPNDDWPLALCDFTSIDPDEDIIANDVVYENSVGEDAFLRFNEKHQWYYLSGQTAHEVILWRNTNLPSGDKPLRYTKVGVTG
ncbi:uncharacterized protein N7483_007568 [Penicillium malachiteum]|uniref:uncharacterized protein n=1 Tax=Penicillium malachiteum TaxID=1324776 RepID=UPI002546D1BD|nr:uncharacterized protein N7483_007568 [Penicillium malachiteum]KAJ5726211.1 hypothetical protein N7483_007568 [Penicillium malachiteum]